MRFIDNSKLKIEPKWLDEASNALNEARTKTPKEVRSAYINGKSGLWSDLKPKLEELSNRKCWYCGSYEKRSDRAVDHYRPKNNVRDSEPMHEGYWWLAFDPTNYRLSCTFCNSIRKDRESGELGGKGDYFPVYDEVKRVKPEGSDFRREQPLLLDPCNALDVTLLDYRDDGRVVPFYSETEKPLAFLRADKSIVHYHLNEVELKEARQALYDEIKKKIADGDFYFEEALNGNEFAAAALESIMRSLANLRHQNSEYSAFAKAIIAGERNSEIRPWLDKIDLLDC